MNQDKKLRLLMAPLIFMVLLHVPVLIGDIAYGCLDINILGSSEVIKYPYLVMLCISVMIWCVTFYHIPLVAYIMMLVVYTVVSWTWLGRQKKGTMLYFIVWLVLCALSIFLYWKLETEYYAMING